MSNEDNPERTVPKEKVTLDLAVFFDYGEEVDEIVPPPAKLFNKIEVIAEPKVMKLPPIQAEEAKGEEQQEQQDLTQAAESFQQKGGPKKQIIKSFQLPEIFKLDISKIEIKKEQLSDYFNYGFTEEVWKRYAAQVVLREKEIEQFNLNDNLKKRFTNKKLSHPVLDFYLPHEFGGLGECTEEKYSQINIFPETVDLPVIKPRTTVNNKNEFNVQIEKIEGIDVADMSLFQKTIMSEKADEDALKELQEKVKEKMAELEKERSIL